MRSVRSIEHDYTSIGKLVGEPGRPAIDIRFGPSRTGLPLPGASAGYTSAGYASAGCARPVDTCQQQRRRVKLVVPYLLLLTAMLGLCTYAAISAGLSLSRVVQQGLR